MAITITIDRFADDLRTMFFPTVRAAMVAGLQDGAREIERETKRVIRDEDMVYTRWLEGSTYVKNNWDGATVGVAAPHAKWLEYGTRPFRPPLEPLAIWAMNKVTSDPRAAWAIAVSVAEKFAREGIKPRHFFLRAVINSNPVIKKKLERRVKAAEGRIFRRVGRSVLG